MGGATVEGLLQGKTFRADDITVSDPSEQALARFDTSGVALTSDNTAAVVGADVVCVVVKPWLVESVLKGIKDSLDYQKQILIVIAAGVPSENINQWLDKGGGLLIPLFLVIPNTAIAVKSSMTFIVPVQATEAQTKLVTGIFDELGGTIVTGEHLLPVLHLHLAASPMPCATYVQLRKVEWNWALRPRTRSRSSSRQ